MVISHCFSMERGERRKDEWRSIRREREIKFIRNVIHKRIQFILWINDVE